MQSYEAALKRLSFTVIRVSGEKRGTVQEVPVIALVDTVTRAVVKVTDFADYLGYRRLLDSRLYPKTDYQLHALAHFLTWLLIEKYARYEITDIRDVTVEMIREYISEYATERIGKTQRFPSKASVVNHRNAVSFFLETMAEYRPLKHIRKGDLMKQQVIADGQEHSKRKTYAWRIPANTMGNDGDGYVQLERYMPLSIVERFIRCAEAHDPELTLIITLSLFGGLREGEICNLCRNNGILGECFRFTVMSGVCTGIEVDLRKNRPLRSDGVRVGKIKRLRRQGFYESFVPFIKEMYEKHLALIKDKPCEDTMPLFLLKEKKNGIYPAMTESAYRKRVKALFWNFVLPSCENDADPDLANFYIQMKSGERTWGPHAFRHLFTVAVVLMLPDADVATVQSLRGDRSPASAQDYLRNKPIFRQKYINAIDRIGQIIMMSGKEIPL